jgi:Carboxypeptidase regulatory-like domain
MRFLRALTLLLAVVAWGSFLWSQTGTSTVRGTVTDQSNRVVAGATVTLTNVDTNSVRTNKTSDTGAYVFDLIIPASYRLEIEAKGFKKKVVGNVIALIGKQTESNVELEVGAATEVVEVQASGQEALINTQDATLGNNFESIQITQLPLEARNLVDLLSLQPGSTREGYVTGARADQSNVTLDGVDINNAQTGNAEIPRTTNTLVIGSLDNDRGNITTGPVLRLNSEAIEEFRVTTANGNANQGRSSGSQVNLLTKSGTNSWHGSAIEYYRSRGFTANDWFNNHATPPFGPVARPPLQRNTFGGGFGGPIVKNKAFFFYDFEGRRDAASTPETRVVPLPNLGQGIIKYSYCTDSACDSTALAQLSATDTQSAYSNAGINPLALQVLADAATKYPANDLSQGDGLNTLGFRFNAPTPVHLNSHVAKLDFNLTTNQTAFFRVNVIDDHQTLPQWLPGTVSPQVWNHPWGLAVGHTWTIGSQWVNNLRYGFTRQAFTQGGDSNGNDLSFRFVFQPTGEQHTLQRVTPVHNFTDDVSWIHGNHNIQFGANIRLISNKRISFATAFDNAITNPSFYSGAGDTESSTFQTFLDDNGLPGNENVGQSLASISEVQNAATAVIGRINQFTADFTFAKDKSLVGVGLPTNRNFATQAFDTYIQDSWKVRPSLTLTLGLRYSLERPVYETTGFEVQPTVPLSTYFAERQAAARQGINFVDPIVLQLSGSANGGKPMYNWDKNNFQPRIAFAWSPGGAGGKSVIRGGIALTNDYYGQALAVDFDLNSTLGFSSNFTTPANTYSTDGANLAPLFTGFGQDIRSLAPPDSSGFTLQQHSDFGERIEQSVDSGLHAPTEYVWNLTYERQLPKGTVISASYIGRAARSLLARQDVVAFNNTVDPKSHMDWYTAATMLEKQRQQGTDTSAIATIPYFDNLFPAGMASIMNNTFGLDPGCPSGDPNAGFDPTWSNTQLFYAMQSRTPSNPCAFFGGNDWTDTQALVDQVLNSIGAPTRFMQPQYGALSTWSTVAYSNYNAFALSVRQRLSSLTLDFNYTFSHSLDNASGIQGDTAFATSSFIVNPIRPHTWYGNSDFDIRHNINASAVWRVPFGKGRSFMSNAHGVAQAILGGWQLSGIYRWNTGLPQFSPYDDARWATNWNVQANVTPTGPIQTCPNRPLTGSPKLFGGCDLTKIYQGFRNAYPGETGPRNYLRLPGYVDLDLGLAKTWTMPWSEHHELQLRWDVFNVTNTQHFGAIDGSRTGFGVVRDPALRGSIPPDNWSNFIQIQGQPRAMQIGARYSF